jgi:uncharacterized membrane protein YidH (DUF202 family)
MKTVGIVLIIVGLAMIVIREVNFTQEKKVVDLGPVEINKKENKKVAWPTYAGIAVAIGGVVVLLAGKRNK